MISVISPTYNCAQYIQRSYDCLKKQTYINWEWVIVNDGSTDRSFDVISEIMESDSRVKYFELNKNKGRGFARNYALNHAIGDIVVVWDIDDFYTSNRLHEINKAIMSGYDYFCSYTLLVDNELNIKGARHFHSNSKIIPKFVHATLGISRAIIDSSSLSYDINMRAGEDLDIMLNLQSDHKGFFCEEYLMIYVEDREVNLKKAIIANNSQFKTILKFLSNSKKINFKHKFIFLFKFIFKLTLLNFIRLYPALYLKTVKLRHSEYVKSNKLNSEILSLLKGASK